MTPEARAHASVMADEALHWLEVRPDGTYVDATAGAGGHSLRILKQLTTGRLVALDRDAEAVARVSKKFAPYPQASVHHANYGALRETIAGLGIERVDGVLIDAGLSSIQLDDPARGFSFQVDGPLDMRMDTSSGMTARAFLQTCTESGLADILRRYGDVGPAGRIARAICARRDAQKLDRTSDLAEAVSEALNFLSSAPEETRTVFQALRIAVNEELRWLEEGIEQAIEILAPGGRLVVISFHSGEDRVVKQTLRTASRQRRVLRPDGRIKEVFPARLRVLTSKPVLPSEQECRRNPRAKSAKLRAAERVETAEEPNP